MTPITGAQAYFLYMRHTLPFLKPSGERPIILAFATHADYLAGIGHRVAALSDCRMLPPTESDPPIFTASQAEVSR